MADYVELHRRLWQLVQEYDGQLTDGARAVVEKLIERLKAEGYVISPEVRDELNQYLNQTESEIRAGIEAAIHLGSPKAMADPMVAALAAQAFAERWPDGLTLSDRLWRFKGDTLRGFERVLQEGARTGRAVSGLVYDLQRQIEAQGPRFDLVHTDFGGWSKDLADAARGAIHDPAARGRWRDTVKEIGAHIETLRETGTRHAAQTVLKKIGEAVTAGNEALIGDAVRWWFYDKQLYLLKRIARTEMATAQHRVVIASSVDDPDVIGFQWRLSSSHPEPDICDYYASIDMGLGKGVWTKDQVPPHKPHSHCMCALSPRVTPVKAPGSTNYAEFLRNSSPERRAQLLPKWAQEAMAAGTPLEKLIRPDGLGLISKTDAEGAKLVPPPIPSAYEAAKSGGKNEGFYRNQRDLPASMIERGIRSMERRLEEHRAWIADPYSKLPRDADPREVEALIHRKWPRDIARLEEQKSILQGILQEKTP